MRAQPVFVRFLSVVAVLAALFGAFIAWVTYALLCASSDNGCGTAEGIMKTQLIVGVIGLIPAAAMVYYSFSGSSRRAVIAFVTGLIVWAVWAVLNDAAVHGWGHNMVLLRLFN
jgi:hypothetical protein